MQKQTIISNIDQCLVQAKTLNTHHPFRRVFCRLAGDETIGLIAYAIWRERSQFLYTMIDASDYKLSEAHASRVSQARSCWQMGSVAFSDLSR